MLCQGSIQGRPALQLGLWGSLTQHPWLMLMALYSVLTMYYMHMSLYEVYVLHDVLGKD